MRCALWAVGGSRHDIALLMAALANCSSLVELNLGGNCMHFGHQHVASALKSLPLLEVLELEGAELRRDGVNALARQLPGCTNLPC